MNRLFVLPWAFFIAMGFIMYMIGSHPEWKDVPDHIKQYLAD